MHGVHVMAVTERRWTWGRKADELRLAVSGKAPFVLPPPQEAAASLDADRVEPREITSPERCDQNVICRSSLNRLITNCQQRDAPRSRRDTGLWSSGDRLRPLWCPLPTPTPRDLDQGQHLGVRPVTDLAAALEHRRPFDGAPQVQLNGPPGPSICRRN